MRRALRVLAGLLVALVLFVAGVVAYGTTLPVAHRAVVEGRIDAPPDAVRERVRAIEDASWRPWVHEVRALPDRDGRRAFVECSDECLTVVVESEDPLVTRIVDHPDFGGTWTWVVTPDGEVSRVVLTEDGEVSNPLFRVFMVHVFGADANIRRALDALQASF